MTIIRTYFENENGLLREGMSETRGEQTSCCSTTTDDNIIEDIVQEK